MILIALLLLEVLSLSSALYDFIGPCNRNIIADSSLTFKKYVAVNNGIWSFVKLPKTTAYESLDIMFDHSQATKTVGIFTNTVYVREKGKVPRVSATEQIYENWDGSSTSYADINMDNEILQFEYKIYTIKYVHNRYVFMYTCSDQGGDKSLDYRYVTVQGKLTKEEESEIEALDKKLNFTGSLIDLKLD